MPRLPKHWHWSIAAIATVLLTAGLGMHRSSTSSFLAQTSSGSGSSSLSSAASSTGSLASSSTAATGSSLSSSSVVSSASSVASDSSLASSASSDTHPAAGESSSQSVIDALFLLRPHCEVTGTGSAAQTDVPAFDEFLKKGIGTCPNFPIRDPHTQETPVLRAGDILDMDLIFYNPKHQPLHRVRAWLSYDPQLLQGQALSVGAGFPMVTPGESDFSPADGYAKIAAEAPQGSEPADGVIVVARIQFKVIQGTLGGKTPVVFADVQPALDAHTLASVKTGADERNVLSQDEGSLLVLLDQAPAQGASSQASSSSSSEQATLPPPQRSPFVLLQVQNLRIGTQGSSVYLSWDPLGSSELIGYNVYYGTQKGRYIQRHSLTPDAASYVIRGLVPGTVYYAAVRGVNSRNEETSFSREVAVKVGQPKTSTAPLTIAPGTDQGPQGQNPLEGNVIGGGTSVPGQSGVSTMAVVVILLSAIAGTLVAVRKQRIAPSANRS